MQFAAFTKSFQDLSIDEVCGVFKKLGLDGLDLTVRPGGHIAPERVDIELPRAVQAAEQQGLKILFLTTAITDANPRAEQLIATASRLGIDRIKLGYYRYRPLGSLAGQMDEVRRRLRSVVKLAARYAVRPCIHIHSGAFIPSHGTLLYELVRDFSPKEIGAYVDSLHMVKEGGGEGWRQGLDLLAPWIAMSSIKNFQWFTTHRDKVGQQRWQTKVVPVADGIAPMPDFIAALKKLGFDGILSLHSEYKGHGSWRDLDTKACIAQTAKDLSFVRSLV